ncbi:N-acetyl-gamma-glutamyl-phosphate reductase [Paenibacillus turpanensis]|uniref:N-acetyl-gamma-glutamyl-phosphate reductase n=1 Tax=Paenibacillus turpanensis TaxID=2689078 RepID=UPI0014086606
MAELLRAAVIGSTGYGGVELIRLLGTHPNVAITSVVSSSQAGQSIADGYPHLQNVLELPLDAIDPALLKEKADVVFLATPHGISAELAPKLLEQGLKVIDLSGDFRLKSGALYEQWYKHKPADAALLEKAVYGLAEVFGDQVVGADFISNPGCYPTATLLGLIPAVQAGWIDPTTIIVDAKTGVSGGGRGLSQLFHYSEINENFLAYKVNKHQHTPEIEQALSWVSGSPVTMTFTTHLVPMTRGIMATLYASMVSGKAGKSDEEWAELYKQYYEGRRFVRVRKPGKYPATKEVWGSNFCDIGISVDARTNRVTIISAIDNLVKGAAGQAVQNLNLMMGWDEGLGLQLTPVYP